MASLTIRNFSDGAKEALRVHAAKAGISLEAYARRILQNAMMVVLFLDQNWQKHS